MKLNLFEGGNCLHQTLGIEPDRKAALHCYAFKIYREKDSKSEAMAELAGIAEDLNELAYLMFHYGHICASQEQLKKSKRSGIEILGGPLSYHDLPEEVKKVIEDAFGNEDEDDERKKIWREGLLTCNCPSCSKVRREMEARYTRKQPRPDAN